MVGLGFGGLGAFGKAWFGSRLRAQWATGAVGAELGLEFAFVLGAEVVASEQSGAWGAGAQNKSRKPRGFRLSKKGICLRGGYSAFSST